MAVCNWRIGLLLLVLAVGCQRAGRYGPPPPPAEESKTLPPSPETSRPAPRYELAWEEPNPNQMELEVPLRFVVAQGKDAAEWSGLKQFWNEVKLPPIAVLQPSPLAAGALAQSNRLTIKVPFGLADPNDYLPPTNRPTLGKWELGKRLFFDEHYLLPKDPVNPQNPFLNLSCARCHIPKYGYTSGPGSDVRSLINSVYNKSQFADGRATYLEEVVQRTLDDERQPLPGDEHVWSGVIKRLRDDPDYDRRFKRVFGTQPTQDAVGKALATYLRTILSGNSLQDRAEQAMRDLGDKTLEAKHYEKILDKNAIETLNVLLDKEDKGAQKLEWEKKADAARQLHAGYQLFMGKGRCVNCHSGPQYMDNGFHTLAKSVVHPTPVRGKEPGRFPYAPTGLKDRHLIGAYKTPTLRALPRTASYFHDGLRPTLFEAIWAHYQGGQFNSYLDPELRGLDLEEKEVRDLVLFLLALDGEPVDPVVTEPPK